MKYGSDIIGPLVQLLVANGTSEQQLSMLGSFVCESVTVIHKKALR